MKKIIDLTKELLKASSDYYNLGKSPLTDKEFDEKYEELKRLEAEYNFRLSDSPTINVGSPTLSQLNKRSVGERPMLSLDKTKTAEDIVKLGRKTVSGMSASIKADGLSVRIVYNEKGELVSAVTRGDGYFGTDITEHIKNFLNVPTLLPIDTELIIDGEAIIKDSDFEIINADNQFKNPRNTAAGTLNLLDMKEVKKRRLSFVAWDVIQGLEDRDSWKARIEAAERIGFEVIPHSYLGNQVIDEETVNEEIDFLMDQASQSGIPCDGIVWRIDSSSLGDALGRTEKFFRNAIAWKPIDEEAESQLLYIDWTMGRTGVLCPVAVFEPIELGGTLVSRASLHNLSVMSKLFKDELPTDKHIVTVIKSNLIIPQIIKTHIPTDNEVFYKFPLPTKCPYCGSELEIISSDDTSNLYCPNPACDAKLINRLDHYCSKKGLDIKHLSKSTLSKLIDKGWLTSLKDLYTLANHKKEWIALSGWGNKSVDNILQSIEESRKCSLDRFLSALGIPQCGPSLAKVLAQECGTYQEYRNRIQHKWDFSGIGNIGESKMSQLLNYDYTEADFIAENYIDFISLEPVILSENQSLTGLNFVITGKLTAYFKNRDELAADISSKGGKVLNAVTKNANYLITDQPDKVTTKSKKAAELGIPVISIEQYVALAK